MEALHGARVTTVNAMKKGQEGFTHPLYVLHEYTTDSYWIHPLCPVYDAPAIGALIARVENGYTVQIVYGRNPSPWEKHTCPSTEGYIRTIECVREDWY